MIDNSMPALPNRSETIETIAAELHISSNTVVLLASQLRIRITYDDQPLSERDAENIRTLYAVTGGAPGPIGSEHDPELDAMRANLGINPHQRRPRRSGPRPFPTPRFTTSTLTTQPWRRPMPPQPPRATPAVSPEQPPLTGAAAAAVGHWPHMPRTVAIAVEANWTQTHGFTVAETIAWWDAGVQFGHPQVARELETYGVRPDHLTIIVRKETVGTRLREGRLNARQVAEMLEREGHLRRAS